MQTDDPPSLQVQMLMEVPGYVYGANLMRSQTCPVALDSTSNNASD